MKGSELKKMIAELDDITGAFSHLIDSIKHETEKARLNAITSSFFGQDKEAFTRFIEKEAILDSTFVRNEMIRLRTRLSAVQQKAEQIVDFPLDQLEKNRKSLRPILSSIINAAKKDFRFLKIIEILESPDPFKKRDSLIKAKASKLTELSRGNNRARWQSGDMMVQLLDQAGTNQAVAESFFPIANRLIRDENTEVWRKGAYCLGSMVYYQMAREYLEQLLDCLKPIGNIHLRRHAYAALGHAALHDPDFALYHSEGLFAPIKGETRRNFKKRQDAWTDASFVYSLTGFYKSAPAIAFAFFKRLSQRDFNITDHYGIHNNLATFVEEILPDLLNKTIILDGCDWFATIEQWYDTLKPHFDVDGTKLSSDPWIRFRQATIYNRKSYDHIGELLGKQKRKNPLANEHNIDVFRNKIESLSQTALDPAEEPVKRVDCFIEIAKGIAYFFDTEYPIHGGSYKTLASHAIHWLVDLLQHSLKRMHSPDDFIRAEAKLHLVQGIRLAGSIQDFFPKDDTRSGMLETLKPFMGSISPEKNQVSLMTKYLATIVERTLDAKWSMMKKQSAKMNECGVVHAWKEEIIASLPIQLEQKDFFKLISKFIRDDELYHYLFEQACCFEHEPTCWVNCETDCSFCREARPQLPDLLPELAFLNGILTETARNSDGTVTLMKDVAHKFDFEADVIIESLPESLKKKQDPRHFLRDEWGSMSNSTKQQVYASLHAFYKQAFEKVCALNAADVHQMNPLLHKAAPGNFASAILSVFGRRVRQKDAGLVVRGDTLFGVLQRPPSQGEDQLQQGGGWYINRYIPDTPIDAGETFFVKNMAEADVLASGEKILVEVRSHGGAEKPPISLPWYLIYGLLTAMAQNEPWTESKKICIERGISDNGIYSITLFPMDLEWKLDPGSSLVQRAVSPDPGIHKVGFWLFWIDRIFGRGRPAWHVKAGSDGKMIITFPLTNR